MKKILLSTAMIVATAGVAAAEVTISGSGRFGIVNTDNNAPGTADTIISYRLRFNVDAKLESDNGVTYGGRIRFQNTESSNINLAVDVDGDGVPDGIRTVNTSPFSPAMLYAEYAGFRIEVGNANTAYDSVALMYNPELGYRGTSFGDPLGSYYSFSSGPYDAGRVGIYAAYSISGVNLKASYIQSNQFDDVSSDDETSIAADYTFGQFTVAAAAAYNGGGINGNDLVFVGAAYAFSDLGTVGLNYNDNGFVPDTYTLYGNYKFGGTTVGAYITDADVSGADTAYGLGASYDLGGATLAASIQSDFASDVTTDLGVSMSF